MDDDYQVLRRILDRERALSKPERTILQMYDEWLSLLPQHSGTTATRRSHRNWLFLRFSFQGETLILAELTPSRATAPLLLAWQNTIANTPGPRIKRLLTPGAVDQVRLSVQAMFSRAVEHGEMVVNPLAAKRGVPRIKGYDKKREGYLTAEQVKAVAAFLPPIEAALFRHTFACGARVGAMRTLHTSEINAADGQLVVQSKGRRVILFVPARELAEMQRLAAVSPSGYVYPNPRDPHGKPMSITSLRRHRKAAFAAAGITHLSGETPVAHHARHGRAVDVLRRTHDITLVQKLLGHNSLSQTLRYASKDDLQAARLRPVLDDE